MTKVRALAAAGPKKAFEPFEYELGDLAPDEVDVDVDYCGLCHTDYSLWADEWGRTTYPFVGGHEIVGRIRAVGENVSGRKVGDTVGVGWFARCDLASREAIAGEHHLAPGVQSTILGRHGGFAKIVRCQWPWAIPLPDDLDFKKAGPLFCGGATVFNPIVAFDVKPTDRVGVIGIGGLGHLATQFLNKWGCEVTAFTSSPDKAEEARRFGAHRTVDSRNPESWKGEAGRFDFLLSTVAVDLDWAKLMPTLGPRGRLHFVGVVPSPIALHVSTMMGGQKSLSASPVGGPALAAEMLDFCARHGIEPLTEHFPMSKVNEAMAHLEAGKARYRIVLEQDL